MTETSASFEARSAPSSYPTLGRRDFYRQLCWGLGLTPSATAAALFRAVSQHVEELAAENRGHPVFVLDEAHLLQDATVEHLHILLNYEWDSRPLLSLQDAPQASQSAPIVSLAPSTAQGGPANARR